jgi:hypothetical protein
MEAAMNRVLMGLVALTALSAGTPIQGRGDAQSIERPFTEGGIVRFNLASGDYDVRAGANDRIRVEWCASDEARVHDLKKLTVDVTVSGSTAVVGTDGPTKHVRFTIEIPERSDMYLRMRAGDVRVDGIEGNKDIRMTAGDLNIGIRPASLSRAHASVTFGDLNARPLRISKGGIKRSFQWIGAGTYTLDARLFAGDLTLSHDYGRR